jgi:hypothetical protein
MSLAEEPGQVRQEFLSVIQPRLEEIELEPDALRLVQAFLRRGSAAVEGHQGVERDELLKGATERLAQFTSDVAAELSRYGGPVSRDTLTSVLRAHCGVGVPPFCYGTAGDADIVAEGGDDAQAVARTQAFAQPTATA